MIQEGSKNRSPRRTHEQGILAIVFGLSPHLFPSTTRQIFFQFLQAVIWSTALASAEKVEMQLRRSGSKYRVGTSVAE